MIWLVAFILSFVLGGILLYRNLPMDSWDSVLMVCVVLSGYFSGLFHAVEIEFDKKYGRR